MLEKNRPTMPISSMEVNAKLRNLLAVTYQIHFSFLKFSFIHKNINRSTIEQYTPGCRWSSKIKTENSYSCCPEVGHITYVTIVSDTTTNFTINFRVIVCTHLGCVKQRCFLYKDWIRVVVCSLSIHQQSGKGGQEILFPILHISIPTLNILFQHLENFP